MTTMGPFTLSQLMPGRNGAANKDDKDTAMKRALASPKAPSVNSKAESSRITKSCGSITQRRPSRIMQNPTQFLQQQQERSSKTLSKKKDIANDSNIPHLGDLDSSDDDEEEEPKSLEQTASNLLAQAVKKPTNTTTPQYSSATSRRLPVTADLDPSDEEDDNKEEKKPKGLEETTRDLIAQATKSPGPPSGNRPIRSSFISMRRTKSMDETYTQANPQRQVEEKPQNVQDGTNKLSGCGFARRRSNEATHEDGREEETEDNTPQRLARQRSKEAVPKYDDLGYGRDEEPGEGSCVRKIAPRRVSSSGKLDAKLERGSQKQGSANGGPATAPVGTISRSLNHGDGNDQESQSDNGSVGRLQRRMVGRRGPGRGHMMRRSSSVSNFLIREKQQLTHSLNVSVRSQEEAADLGYEDHDNLDGRRPQQQQKLSRDHSLGRRRSGGFGIDPYDKNDSDSESDDSRRRRDRLGYGDAQPGRGFRQREERRSIGYGGMTTDGSNREPTFRQQRRSMGHGAEQSKKSIGYGGVMSGDSEREVSQRRRPTLGLTEGDESGREPSFRGRRNGMGDSQPGTNCRRSSLERDQRGVSDEQHQREKSNERNPSICMKPIERNQNMLGKRGNATGLDGSRDGHQRRQSQAENDPGYRQQASGEHKKSLSPDLEENVRAGRYEDSNANGSSSLVEEAQVSEVQKDLNTGKLDAKIAKQPRTKKRSSVGSSESLGSHSSGDAPKRSGQRHQSVPKNVRRANSDGMTASGKLDRKLGKQNGSKQRKFNDSFLSGNSEQSGDSLGSSRSERSAKLSRMLNREVRNKRRSLHDSLKSGISSGSAESKLSTRSSPAATGKGFRRKGGKKKSRDDDDGLNSHSGFPQREDTGNEESKGEEIKDDSESSASSHGSVRSVQSCHTTLGRAHQRLEFALVGSASNSLLAADYEVGGKNTRGNKGRGKLHVRNQGLAGFIPKNRDSGNDDDGNPLRKSRRSARQASKTEGAMLGRRAFSLTERRSTGDKVVRSFSMRNAVGGLLHSDHTRNSHQGDDESEKDDIICYASDENNDDCDSLGSDSHSDEEDEDKLHEDDTESRRGKPQESHRETLRPRETPEDDGKSNGAIEILVSAARDVTISDCDEDTTSVRTGNSDGSADIWDELENGSMIDSDSRSSGSDKGDGMMSLSRSGKIVNWDGDEEDDKPDYLNPAMSPHVSTFGKRKATAPKMLVEGMPSPMTLNKKEPISKAKKTSESKRLSLLGGFQQEDDEDTTDSVNGSVLAPSVSDVDLRNTKRLKKKKSKKDVLKSSCDKFDWEGKAKEDKKRENKKKKKEFENELTISLHLKKERKSRRIMSDDKAEKGKMKRAVSMRGLGKVASLDESSHRKDTSKSSKGRLRRCQSVEIDESTREETNDGKQSSPNPNEEFKLSPRSEKKRRATMMGVVMNDMGHSKSRRASRSKSPSHLASLEESNCGHAKAERARSSRRRKSAEKSTDFKTSKTSADTGKASTRSSWVIKGKKGVRRTKSVDGIEEAKEAGGESTPKMRSASVKRSSSSNTKMDDAPKRNKSKLRKKKSSSENDSHEQLSELLRLLEQDPKAACAFIDKDPSVVETRDKDGCFPLHFAAHRDLPLEVLEKLIEVFPEACDTQCEKKGFTPLHFAVEANAPTPKIKVLIKACPRALKTQDRKGQVPLHIAVSQGARLSSVRLLVFIYPESVDIETAKGETARKIAKRKKANPEVLNELKSGKFSAVKS